MEVSGEYCSSTSTTRSTEEQNQREKHYRGVRMKKWGKWGAEILERTKRERIWLGSYSSPVAAARAYDTAAFYLQGPSRKLNFPEYIVEEDGNNLDMSVASIQKKAKEVGARVDALESALENGRCRIETEAVGTEGDGIREDQIEPVGIGGEGTREDEIEGEGMGEDEMAEAGLNTACLGKGKRKENTAGGGERETKKIGVRIAIPLEDILQSKEDAAINLRNGGMKYAFDTCAGTDSNTVSQSTEHGIPKWPPSKNNELISNSLPTETPVDVAQEQIPQSSSDILPPNQVLPIIDSNSMTVKARHVNGITMKFRLSSPWRKVELEQQVQKRLQLEAGTYYIKYKDMENELILIGCDDDLEDCISNSRSTGSSSPSSKSIGTSSIEVFLEPK